MTTSSKDLLEPSRAERPLDPTAVRKLADRTSGAVTMRDHEDYPALVSPWNLAVPVAPAAVVAARTAQDVVAAVRFAGEHELLVTPQATGHGPMEELIGELLVTTKGLDECTVHPEGWARVGAGVKWLRVVEAAAPHGLAPLSGSITDVGVVGYTTGGGVGPMARTHGLASDRVRAFEVVTGDGVLRRATPTEHPELYFGLRGGKGSLGIVTAVEFDLVHQPSFYGGSLWFDGADAEAVVEAWRAWSAELPELGTTSFALFRLPAMPAVPPPLAERFTVSIRYVWTGDAAEGERRFAAMRAVAPIILDAVEEKPYTAIDSVHTDPLDPMPVTEAAEVLTDFPAEALAALLDVAGPGVDSPQFLVELRQLGGAFARSGAHDCAFSSRDAAYSLLVVGLEDPAVREDAATILAALSPWAGGHRLPNFTYEPGALRNAFDPTALARLRSAMRTYDADGVMAIGHALR